MSKIQENSDFLKRTHQSCKDQKQYSLGTLHLVHLSNPAMPYTLHSLSVYTEIVRHAALDLMTKLTEYPSGVKQEEKRSQDFFKRLNEIQ